MKMALLAASVALLLAACTRTDKTASGAAPSAQQAERDRNTTTTVRPLEERTLYSPSRERALTEGDNSSDDMQWQPLGRSFPALTADVRYGLVLTDTVLTDRDGNPMGTLLPETSRFTVLEVGDWERGDKDFHRSYHVTFKAAGKSFDGWIDSSSSALMLGEAGGIAVGMLPRKIVVGGGESEYSLLVVSDGRRTMVVDTSMFPFPGEFHPSGVMSVSVEDANSDSLPEIVLEAETIVSLRYLGATPVRWKAWLRPRPEGLVPVFRYNVSFGSDAGYSYVATERAFDSNGGGTRDVVRVDTDYTLVTGPDEFRTSTVSFYPWNGSAYQKAALQDLPKVGTVARDTASLFTEADERSAILATLSRGEQLYVFDRGDSRQSREDPASWWYKAVSKTGVEGWISGTAVELSWIDPLKVNRAEFLARTRIEKTCVARRAVVQ